MYIHANEKFQLVLREIFDGAIIETEEGVKLLFCMRDGTIEMKVAGAGVSYRVNPKTSTIETM